MRVGVLSDHGSQQLSQTEHHLQAAEADVVSSQHWYQQTQANLDAARRNKPLLKRIFAVSTSAERDAAARVNGAWHDVRRADSNAQQIYGRRQQQAAGILGENKLAGALAVLSDDWVMLRGYRNRRGETDHVLVGPPGVWVIEVKYWRVRLNIDGDMWWYEKLDHRGNIVDTGLAVDGGGRSWAQQVNEVAVDLQAWLTRNRCDVPISTAVMLMNDGAWIGRWQNLTVNLVANNPAHLLSELGQHQWTLSPQSCEEIVRLIRRDHQFHANRRRSRRRY
jgi:hypothetical protein